MLEIRNLSTGYGALTVLENISLRFEEGERIGIFGHNGAGKTTLMRSIMGAQPRFSGEVLWNEKPLPVGDVPTVVTEGIAFVPQGHNVFPNLSVEQNLKIAGLRFGQDFVAEIYGLFPVLANRRAQRAGSMSGGEQQMLALGMALMTKPKWLLLDEPSTGLAPVIVRNVMGVLGQINERLGTGLIVVEQNVPATLKLVSRAVIIKSGAVVFDGEAQALSDNKDLWKWF